jgi:hypothetical protein
VGASLCSQIQHYLGFVVLERRTGDDVRLITLSLAPLHSFPLRHFLVPSVRGRDEKRLEEAIGRILYPSGRRPFIWAARYRAARAANPGTSPTQGGMRGQATLGPPIRPCSARGLPCPPRFRRGGALLPHPFTLTPGDRGRSALCGTFPRVTTAGRYPACRLSWSPDLPPETKFRRTPTSSSRGKHTTWGLIGRQDSAF